MGTRRRRWVVSALMIAGAMVMVSTLVYIETLGFSVQLSFGESALFEDLGSPALTLFVNAAVAYTHQIGVILPLAFLGMIIVFRRYYLTSKALYPITLVLSFVPVVGSSLYVSMLLSVFVSVLGVIWISRFLRRGSKNGVAVALVAVLVVGSLAFPAWSVDRWNELEVTPGETVLVDNGVYNDGNYMRTIFETEYAIVNQERLYLELQSMTALRYLGSGIQSTMNDEITGREVKDKVTPSEVGFPRNLYSWFKYEDALYVHVFVVNLMYSGAKYTNYTIPETYVPYAESHSKLYVIIDNADPTHFTDQYGTYTAVYPGELRNAVASGNKNLEIESYVIYQSHTMTAYVVKLSS